MYGYPNQASKIGLWVHVFGIVRFWMILATMVGCNISNHRQMDSDITTVFQFMNCCTSLRMIGSDDKISLQVVIQYVRAAKDDSKILFDIFDTSLPHKSQNKQKNEKVKAHDWEGEIIAPQMLVDSFDDGYLLN
jgi:hypothetical protein